MVRKIALLSDVHANKAALNAVLEDIKNRHVDAYWFLGDALGRGPEPLAVSRRLKTLYDKQEPADQRNWLVGNHDLMVLGEIGTDFFMKGISTGGMDGVATEVALKHRHSVEAKADIWKWLAGMPTYHHPSESHLFLAHGQYRIIDGVASEIHAHSDYAFAYDGLPAMMRNIMANAPQRPHVILLGHTHIPGVWRWDATAKSLSANYVQAEDYACIQLDNLATQPVIINPGSAGFPRDGRCPTYMCLTLTDETNYEALTIEFFRVSYNWQDNQIPDHYKYPQAYIDAMASCLPHKEDPST